MRDKKEMSDMTESEISYRKFLKNLGVTTHKEIEELVNKKIENGELQNNCLLYTSPSPRDNTLSRMPSSA